MPSVKLIPSVKESIRECFVRSLELLFKGVDEVFRFGFGVEIAKLRVIS